MAQWTRTQSLALLSLLCLALYLPGMTQLPIIDRDAPHFAQATKQMLESGNFFQIRFQETTRFQKPPGINWLHLIPVSLFGPKAWAFRLISLLGGLFSVLLTYLIARRHFGQNVGFMSASLLATTLLLTIESHLIVIDAMLLTSVLFMQGALFKIYTQARPHQANAVASNEQDSQSTSPIHAQASGKSNHAWCITFWLAMSAGICLKGVTPLVGFGTVGLLCVFNKSLQPLRATRPFWGLLILLLSSSWLLWVNAAENTNYLWQIIQKDLMPKLQGGHESHGAPMGYHLVLLPLMFFPASIFLWQGIKQAWAERHNRLVQFLIAWIVPTWLFFELMPTKLPQYVLPTFPALAMLCSLALQARVPGVRWLYYAWGLVMLTFGASFIGIQYYLNHSLSLLACIPLIAIITMLVIALPAVNQQRFHTAFKSLVATAVVIYWSVLAGLLPQQTSLWLTERIAKKVQQDNISANNPLVSVGYGEPSLVFTLGTQSVRYANIHSIHNAPLVLIDSRHYAKLGNSQYTIRESLEGFNYNKGEWVHLHLLVRDEARKQA